MLKINDKIVERPRNTCSMRVACGIHSDDVAAAIETYHLMSEKILYASRFTHAV